MGSGVVPGSTGNRGSASNAARAFAARSASSSSARCTASRWDGDADGEIRIEPQALPGIRGEVGAPRPELVRIAGNARRQVVDLAHPGADVRLAVPAAPRVAHARHLRCALGVVHAFVQVGTEPQPTRGIVVEIVGLALDRGLRLERLHHARQPRGREYLANAEPRRQPVVDRLLALDVVRRAPGQEPQIPHGELATSFGGRRGLQQPHDLHPAPVRHVDLPAVEVRAQLGQQVRHLLRDPHLAGRLL